LGGICPADEIALNYFSMKMMLLIGLMALAVTGCATRTYTITPPPRGPNLAQVQAMVNAHVSDPEIINQINNSSTRYRLTVDQIIALKNAGVSAEVINALINTANKVPPPPATVIEERYVYPPPYPYIYIDPWPAFWWGWGPYYPHYHHWR
jgi:hypothetical protein